MRWRGAGFVTLSLSLSLCVHAKERGRERRRRFFPSSLFHLRAPSVSRSLAPTLSRARASASAAPSFSAAVRPCLSAREERPAEAVYDGRGKREGGRLSLPLGAACRRFLESISGGALEGRQRTTAALICMLAADVYFPPKSISRSRRSGRARTRTHAYVVRGRGSYLATRALPSLALSAPRPRPSRRMGGSRAQGGGVRISHHKGVKAAKRVTLKCRLPRPRRRRGGRLYL